MSAVADMVGRHPELAPGVAAVRSLCDRLGDAFRAGGKLLVCGNGGSAADADHIVGELVKPMLRARPLSDEHALRLATVRDDATRRLLLDGLQEGYPAIALTTHTSLVSAIGNDMGWDLVFAQQVMAHGRAGDVLWAISTSGSSRNVVLAAATARALGLVVVAMTGAAASPLSALGDVVIRVPADDVAGAQELHRAVYHAVCAELEGELFAPPPPAGPPGKEVGAGS